MLQMNLYKSLQQDWQDKLSPVEAEELVLLQVSGGIRDQQIRVMGTTQYGRQRSSTRTNVKRLHVIDATAPSVPRVHLSADHQVLSLLVNERE